MDLLRVCDLGRINYAESLAIQRRLADRLKAGPGGKAYLLLLEHDPPVITIGRRGRPEHILATPEQLATEGIEVHQIGRGGDVTWHGPGQLVGYPIGPLAKRGRGVAGYIRSLERALIAMLSRFGIEAGRRVGRIGVWVGDEKIAAIGVRVSRWVAYHGLAVNADCDLAGFRHIIPCGIDNCRATSMTRAARRDITVSQVKPVLVESLCEAWAVQAKRIEPSELP